MVRQDLQRSALGPDYSMEVYVDGRHAKIGRGHKVALIGAHARNQDGIGHCIKSAVVTNSEVRDLGQFSLVANPKFLRHFFSTYGGYDLRPSHRIEHGTQKSDQKRQDQHGIHRLLQGYTLAHGGQKRHRIPDDHLGYYSRH